MPATCRTLARWRRGLTGSCSSARARGQVYAVVNRDGQHRFTSWPRANQPSGVASATARSRRRGEPHLEGSATCARSGSGPPSPSRQRRLSSDAHHGWKFIAFGGDGASTCPSGRRATCALPPVRCTRTIHATRPRRRPARGGGARRAQQRRVRLQPEPASSGSPTTARDLARRRSASDELNRTRRASTFGFHYFTATALRDPSTTPDALCAEFSAPPAPWPARRGARHALLHRPDVPRALSGRHLISEHGSWNRSTPIGNASVSSGSEGGRATSYEPFARDG